MTNYLLEMKRYSEMFKKTWDMPSTSEIILLRDCLNSLIVFCIEQNLREIRG